jgi:hypothetical protein
MDGQRFDVLLRSLSLARSRRGLGRACGVALAMLGVPGLVHLAAEDGAAKRKKRKRRKKSSGTGCAGGLASCDGACVDLKTDADHCGGCGEACVTGESCCRWNCVDTNKSEDHCGECGNACDNGEVCVAGQCSSCTQGFVCGGTVPFCNTQYTCGCTSVLEGGVVCGSAFCSNETCASTAYCVNTYGPFAVCQAPGTGCCGQKCVLPCPSVIDRRAGHVQSASELSPGTASNFASAS